MLDLLLDLWGFLKVRKKFWLLPIIVMMLLLAILLIVAQNAVVAPFVYSFF